VREIVTLKYCLDSSFLINGWHKHYRLDVFPSLWRLLEKMIVERQAFFCEEVLVELEEQDDALLEWAIQRKGAFRRPNADVIQECKRVMARFPNLAAKSGSRNSADPWVIALAAAEGAAVVTGEAPAPSQRATKPPKIPDICDAFGIAWLRPIDFLASAKICL